MSTKYVWMIYPPEVPWVEKIPPVPLFWQHQLWDVDEKKKLNVAEFDEKIMALLAQFK